MFELVVLAPVLTSLLLKSWAGDVTAAVGDKLVEQATGWLKDWRARQKAENRAREIAGSVIDTLQPLFDTEHRGADKAVVVTELQAMLEACGNSQFLVTADLDATRICKAFFDAHPISDIAMGGANERLYQHAAKRIAAALAVIAPELPGFVAATAAKDLKQGAEALRRLDTLTGRVEELLLPLATLEAGIDRIERKVDEASSREQKQFDEYASSYRRKVADLLDYVEILGLDIERSRRQASLSVAYLSLSATLSSPDSSETEDAERKSQRLEFPDLMDRLPLYSNRLLIEGPAGCGKSTLMRWAAIAAARSPSEVKDSLSRMMDWRHRRSTFKVSPSTQIEAFEHLFETEKEALTIHPGIRHAAMPAIFRPGDLPIKFHDKPLGFGLFQRVYQAVVKQSHLNSLIAFASETWKEKIPILVRLRHLTAGRLPPPHELPMQLSNSIGRPPDGWVERLLEEGKAIVLFDGIDEVPEGKQRKAVLAAICDHVRAYPSCTVIVTSRPRAFDKADLQQLEFAEANVDELTPEQQIGFIDNWHQALAVNLDQPKDAVEFVELSEQLKRLLSRRPDLRRLASNPLLCAGICALHERRPGAPPQDASDLCAKLTEMLVELRDRTQGRQEAIRFEDFGRAYRLEYPKKRAILARVAEAMVSQELSALSRADALHQVELALREIKDRDELTSEDVLAALEARSGVLRSGSGDRLTDDDSPNVGDTVEFAHNTLKAWLAAQFYLDEQKPLELAGNVLKEGYSEVLVFAAAGPRDYAARLIDALLKAGQKKDKDNRRRLILALRCEAIATSLPEKLRARLAKVPKRLFPPHDFTEAQELVVLENAAIPLLLPRDRLKSKESAACVRCLRLIDTSESREALGAWRDSRDMAVVEELAQVFDPLTIPMVIAATESQESWQKQIPDAVKHRIVALGALRTLRNKRQLFLDETRISDLKTLSDLVNLESLSLSETQVTDLRPLAGLVRLQSLTFMGSQVSDLSPLAGLVGLQSLSLGGTQVTDLSPLEGLVGLHSLFISAANATDFSPLASLVGLRSLFIGTNGVTDLTPLASLIGLQSLYFSATRVTDLSPLASLVGLQSLTLVGNGVADLSPLASLVNLQSLDLIGNQLTDLSPLASLVGLQSLDLIGTQVADLSPLAGLVDLKSLTLMGIQVADLSPLADLVRLQRLDLRETQVTDLSPLTDLANLQQLILDEGKIVDLGRLESRRDITIIRKTIDSRA